MRVEEGRQDSEEGPPARARGEPGRLPKLLWLAAGWLSLAAGFVGIFLPLLPTVPFVLLAAFCFSRGSARCERWLLGHPRFGPWIEDWRANRAVPLRAKQLATLMMAAGGVLRGSRCLALAAADPRRAGSRRRRKRVLNSVKRPLFPM